MDQSIRNKLRSVVTQCRKLLEEAVSQVLQGQFGIYESGKKDEVHVEEESRLKNLSEEDKGYRRDIQAHLGHIEALGYKAKDSLAQLVREIAFTHLNRLCAYKMMEARAVWIGSKPFRESVSRGMKSQGFQFYLADHPEDKQRFDTGHQDVAYRHFLGWLGALLSEEIGVLFSPTDPANRLFPPQRVLDDVLALLNSDDLKDIWGVDETIGWVYQYFTPKELRDQVRKESAAPRNSYELAFRNQFFTPRYVVEFLTDNTLGRIWYEMRKGDTKLKDQCRYMVRRPVEVFEPQMNTDEHRSEKKEELNSSSDICVDPCSSVANSELSQEELLKQPVHIPHRQKKDPRELRILDPACGSGHFLLYCFDLLLTIYEEAYADPDLGPKLKADYPTLEALRRDVPRLILAHNLHGIDIDLRASQIAALALWLRCQRAYREMGLKQDRPRITKSNIVCAEPMPGEKEMLDEFLKTLKQDRLEDLIRRVMQVPEGTRVRATESMVESLGELVRLVWDKMQLAGEAGSLLKIEEELQEAVRSGQEEWEEKQPLFRFTEFGLTEKPKESYVRYVPGEGVSFWQRAEALVLEALRDYARHAANGGRLQRQLFANDAAQGFAFIDTCQKKFDVVLMNPPFGGSSKPSKAYLEKAYPNSKNDMYAAFVERGLELLLSAGLVGAITSRTGFFVSTFQKWRENVLLGNSSLTLCLDLGIGVLDTAMVETAAYCLQRAAPTPSSAIFAKLLAEPNKPAKLTQLIDHLREESTNDPSLFIKNPQDFRDIPASPFAYWVSERIRRLFRDFLPFESDCRKVRGGLKTGDDFRFVRTWWEVPNGAIVSGTSTTAPNDFRTQTKNGRRWVSFAKGGSFSPYFCDLHLVVDWLNDGSQSWEFYRQHHQRCGGVVRNPDVYFLPGLTWAYRTHRLCLQELPSGAIISVRGSGIFADFAILKCWLALGNSLAVDSIVKLSLGRCGHPQFNPGDLQIIPYPTVDNQDESSLEKLALENLSAIKHLQGMCEVSRFGLLPLVLQGFGATLEAGIEAGNTHLTKIRKSIEVNQAEIDELAYKVYGFSDGEMDIVSLASMEGNTPGEDDELEEEEAASLDWAIDNRTHGAELISHAVGCVVGRWDVRYAAGLTVYPNLPGPFEPLPASPPGMLQNADRVPVRVTTNGYPLHIKHDGIIPDDPDHSDDIVRRVREVLELIWKDRAEAIEKESCEILGVEELRNYFRRPGKGGFWDDHVSRYSKSRRKAPIYWLLQSSKKNYGLWLYYHRLDKDILFKARQNYVEPKIRLEQTRLDSLRSQKTALGAAAKGAKKIEKDIERQEALLGELNDFADKLERAAKLNVGKEEKLNSDVVYDPDLNDGVVLNIAPLWELVPWKEAKNYWEELLEGKYEWSSMGKLLRKKGLVK